MECLHLEPVRSQPVPMEYYHDVHPMKATPPKDSSDRSRGRGGDWGRRCWTQKPRS